MLVNIIGTRPQYIKSALLQPELIKEFDTFNLDTGQHYSSMLSSIHVKDYDLKFNNVLSYTDISFGEMIDRIFRDTQLLKAKAFIVYGDTNSSLAGAIVAKQLGCKLIHIEAGMRASDALREDFNRRMIDSVSDVLLCSSEQSLANLKKENKKGILVGDLHYDMWVNNKSKITVPWEDKDYVLCTIHRKENYNRLQDILEELGMLDDIVVMPTHPNVRRFIKKYCDVPGNVKIVKPVSYSQMKRTIIKSKYVVTDSGGLQKESYFGGKFCYVVRDNTEWTELLEENCVLCNETNLYKTIQKPVCCEFNKKLYGDGHAVQNIIKVLRSELC